MSTSLTSPSGNVPFTGLSQYASDFQAILNKAVQVAQIPVTQLQTQDSAILSKETALGGLSTSVGTLAASLKSLGTLATQQALSATSSDPSVVTAAVSGPTVASSYTINSVTSVASAASERSIAGFSDSSSTPVGNPPTFTLQFGAQTQTFTLANNSLVGLRDQINSLGNGLTASILTTANGNFLSLQAHSTGATTLKLFAGAAATGTDLLTNTNQGADAVFELNGIPVDQSGNTVNSVIPGLTLTIQGQSDSSVTVSLASDPSQLSSGLQDFVNQYNALQTQLASQIGAGGGALAGDTLLNQVRQTLQQLTSYTTSTGSVQSLADLGVNFNDTTGQLTFDQTMFDSLSQQQISDGFTFLGSASTGLAGFSQSLTEFSDPVTGLIQSEAGGLKTTDLDLQNQIAALNTNVANTTAALTKQLEAADAAQAELQQQQTNLTASLQGLELVLYGKTPGSLG